MSASFRGGMITMAAVLAACSTTTQRIEVDPVAAAREEDLQRQAYVRKNQADQGRVQSVAFPLLVNSAELCGDDVRPALGFLPLNVNGYPKEYRAAAATALGLGEELQVAHVVADGPADLAGLKVGDRLISLNGEPVPAGDKAAEKFLAMADRNLQAGTPVALSVVRDELPRDASLTPVQACNYLVALINDDQVNAYADGRNIYVTSGMLRFVDGDVELATVIGHELAHNAMGHIDKKKGNYLLGSIFDVVAAAYGVNTQGLFGNAAARAFSQDFEAEADYVGLYVMERAGVPIDGAPDFWRRMGLNSPGSIKTVYSGTHPGTAERYLALEKGIEEVHGKDARGEPMRPTLKSDKKAKSD